jgi:hypothetical protein
MDRRAVVVQQAWDDRLTSASAPADLLGGLQHGHIHAGLGEGDRGGQAVGPGADDDRRAHATAGYGGVGSRMPASDQVTLVGIGPLGSHGCSLTASDTFQVPRSITPRAASMTL